MSRPWSAWHLDLMPHLPGCSITLVEHEVKRAAQEFFEGSRAWRVMLDPIPVAVGEIEVDVVPDDSKQDLVRIEQAWFDDVEITLATAESMSSDYGQDWPKHTGVPSRYLLDTPGVLRPYPVPSADSTVGLVCRISVKPADSATGIPDDLARKFHRQIAAGAKARLMLYAGKPWTNVEMGAVLQQTFNGMIDKANAEAARGFGGARIASRTRWC